METAAPIRNNPSNRTARSLRWLLLALGIGALSIVITQNPCRTPPTKYSTTVAPRAETISRIKDIRIGLKLLEEEFEGNFQSILNLRRLDSVDINAALTCLFTNRCWFRQGRWVEGDFARMVDAWGQPFVVRCRTNVAQQSFASGIRRQTNAILIWSVGQNRHDEKWRWEDICPSPHWPKAKVWQR